MLMRAFDRCGIRATLQSGQAPQASQNLPGNDCGVFTANGWEGHAWVEANGFVIDITADQFGHPPIIVTPASDPTYRPALDATHRLTPTKSGIAAIDLIWPLWCSYADQQRPLLGSE